MFWTSVLEIAVGVVAGGAINAYFARRGSQELRQEAERLRRLTLKLIQILAASEQIEVSTWDPETGEPSSWPVGGEREIRFPIEAPTPRWRRLWRRIFGEGS